jgi:hypothetical protein
MSEKYSDAITGHAPPTAGRKYGKPTPEDLAEALRRFPRYALGDPREIRIPSRKERELQDGSIK